MIALPLFFLLVSAVVAGAFVMYYLACYASRRLDRARAFYETVANLLRHEVTEWSVSDGDTFSPWRFNHHETGVSIRIGEGLPILDQERRVLTVGGARPGFGWRQLLRHRAGRLVARRDKIRNYEALISSIENFGSAATKRRNGR